MSGKNPFFYLSRLEWVLWLSSVAVITLSFLLSGGDWLTITASLVGVTALIFIAKGFVLGQALTVVFSVLYGVISFFFCYYGEIITYLCMTLPMAVLSLVSWLRHPYQGTRQVAVARLTVGKLLVLAVAACAVTAALYFVLRALGTANLTLSTVSVTTSFVACMLTFYRSPFYALGYAANDVVLIALWILAAMEQLSYLPMVFCFVMFLLNDLYGFYSWQRMEKYQAAAACPAGSQ
jgi:nicotinamide mononucleotide transporter